MDLFTTAPLTPAFDLDAEQSAAATAPTGSNAVIAGAGTGKTRTLVARILHLIEGGADPVSIRCMTFTNRAAREIAERVRIAFPGERQPQIGTFHAQACRILRKHAAFVGLTPRFLIIDHDERRMLLKEILERGEALLDVGEVERRIDGWKAAGLTTEAILESGRYRRSSEEEACAAVFVALQREMRRRDVVEFGDLVLEAVRVMSGNEVVRQLVAGSVCHLLVDEAQDANQVQVAFARHLCSAHGDVFVVGDEDQSIYSFQGGSPLALFQIAGPDAVVWRLTQNRRSTDEILQPAVRLVACNARATDKALTSGVTGSRPVFQAFGSEQEEAREVADRVVGLIRSSSPPPSIAVLVRTAWVLPVIEEAMIRAGVPYELIGGTAFAKREEVKDICAFLRLACDPTDDLAFRRIANKPTRGIGPSTEEALIRQANSEGLSFFEACERLTEVDGVRMVSRDGVVRLGEFLSWLNLGYSRQGWVTSDFLNLILGSEGIDYERWATKDRSKARRRREVFKILRRMAIEEDDAIDFLDRVALGDNDEEFTETHGYAVRLGTMHGAKGLEWDHVFLPAFERGILPTPKASLTAYTPDAGDPWAGVPIGGIDEERRLAHVAITRAKVSLTVTAAQSRGDRSAGPSRFAAESGLLAVTTRPRIEEAPCFGAAKKQPRPKKRRNALF